MFRRTNPFTHTHAGIYIRVPSISKTNEIVARAREIVRNNYPLTVIEVVENVRISCGFREKILTKHSCTSS